MSTAPQCSTILPFSQRQISIPRTRTDWPDGGSPNSSPTCDASGNGEGQTFLGAVTVNTDGNGDAAWNLAGLPQVAVGSVITATATSPTNNTSEFSACRTVVAANTGAIVLRSRLRTRRKW